MLNAIAHDKRLSEEVTRLRAALGEQYDTDYASLAVPFDTVMVNRVQELVAVKQQLHSRVLIIVGIGGSNLGTKAIYQALYGRFHNASNPTLKVYFLDTVDSDRIAEILRIVQSELEAGHAVIVNVITKSGTTTETIINFHTILALLKKFHPTRYCEYVVVTTDCHSPLWHSAQREGFAFLEIPKKVGGRYSVFSAVGLFPLALCGISLERLHEGARAAIEEGTRQTLEENPALLSALLLYSHYTNNVTVKDLFLFSLDLEAVGKWYRQLLGESIGKEFNRSGKQVMVGITPTVSLGSIDLHSVAQLYLAGPRDKFTMFVTVEKNKHSVTIPDDHSCAGKTFEDVMDALVKGTQRAYFKNKRPFCTVTLPEKNEYCLGQFLQFKMLEMMYLGYLLDVNPFDQPNVELYKKETHTILGC